MDKMLLSVPGAATTHGIWAHAWPSHMLLRQVQNASGRSAACPVKANVTFSCHLQLWHTHKVHKLSNTQKSRTIHTWHVTVHRLCCRLQACREVPGSGAQLCWLLHSCALVMTVATRGGVSSPIGGWQPTMYSVSSRPGGTEAGGGGLGHNSHSWGHGSSSGGSSSSRHKDNGMPGNILGLFAPVS